MAQVREFGYEYDAVRNERLWQECGGRCARKPGVLLLRSGRDALKVIAREHGPARVLLPALACDSMVQPFTMYGCQVEFYRLNRDYSIAWESLEDLVKRTDATTLLLYMNYFGKAAATDEQLYGLRETYPHLLFIEDRTHDLIYPHAYSFGPDYTVASLRKWANVPDGGLLWTGHTLDQADYSQDLAFSHRRLEAQCMRNRFFATGDAQIKTAYRGIFSTVTDLIDADPLPGRMSEYAYRLAEEMDWTAIQNRRRENAGVLLEALRSVQGIQIIQKELDRSNLYLPVLVEHRDAVQRALASQGIFCTLIWPLSQRQKECCQVAQYTEAHMLAIPCDQRYTARDMEHIGRCFAREVGNQNG